MNQSALEGGEGEEMVEAVGRQVEAGVQSSTGRPKLSGRHKIGYADSNGGLMNVYFRAGPGRRTCASIHEHSSVTD